MIRPLLTAALALTTAPALAQAPICGGISAVGEWVGGAPDASDLTTADAAFDADGAVPIGGHLVRMFTLSEPTDIRAEVAAQPEGDPYMSLYDAGGTEMASDDDSGGAFAARIETSLEAGTYCLAARSYESGVTDVALRVGRADHDPLTEGDAAPVPEGSALPDRAPGAGCFQPGTPMLALPDGSATASLTQAPAYGFTLDAPGSLTVRATSELGDPLIRVIDTEGTELAENDDYDGLDSRIDLVDPLPAGAYCIEVEDLNGAANPITVLLEPYDPAAVRRAAINAGEVAPGAEDGDAVTDLGLLQTALLHETRATDVAQWVRFEMPEAGLLLATAAGDDADPELRLFDHLGRQVGYNDDGPDGLDSLMAVRLFPGEYRMAVRLVSGDGAPVEMVLERYVPAR